MKKFLFFALCIYSSVLCAQSTAIPQWAFASGGVGNSPSYVNEVMAITTDHAGHVITGGGMAGTIDLDPSGAVANVSSVNTTHINAFVAKYDTLHNFHWGFSLYSPDQSFVSDIGSDAVNNVYAAGEYINQMDADPSAGTYLLNASAAGRDLFVAKYSPGGNFVWAFGIGSNLSTDYMNKMITDNDGNVYITGRICDSADFDPSPAVHRLYSSASGGMYLAKYDSSGNYVWAFSIDEPSNLEEGQSLAFDGYGNIILGMVYRGTIDADPSAGTASFTAQGVGDALIARYNMATGNYVSAFSIGGGTGGPSISSVVVAANQLHQLAVSGRFWGNLDFDPGPGTHYINNANYDDIFLARYSYSGNLIWVFNIGNNTGTVQPVEMASDNTGKIYLLGDAYGSADVDPGPASVLGADFIAVYDSSGSFDYINGFAATTDLFYKAFHLFAPDGFYLGGGFEGMLYLSPTFYIFGATNWNAFLARYAQCLPPSIQSQSLSTSLCREDNLLLDINAVGTDIHYQWYKDSLIYNDTLPTLQLTNVDTSDSGTYYCILTGLCGADTSQNIVITVHLLPVPVVVQVGSNLQTGVFSAYQWYMNGTLIPSATNQIYTPTVTAVYFVIVTDTNGCSDTSNYLGFTVGVNELNAANDLFIYPNPVADHLNISFINAMNNVQAMIINAEGKEVKNYLLNSSNNIIDVSSLANGIYTLRIIDSSQSQSYRFVKLKE